VNNRQLKKQRAEQYNREYVRRQEYQLAREIMQAEGLPERGAVGSKRLSLPGQTLALMAALGAIPYDSMNDR
jgi:hypothetical protein